MTEPTTPVVSAARREQVIDALIWNHHMSEDGDIPFVAMADAAIAALLPDAEQFMDLLDDLMYSATEYGHAAPNSERERRASRKTVEARDALIALVYGEKEERE